MPWSVLVLIGYGLFNIILGVVAFIVKHSVPSIVSGGIAGIIIIACALAARQHPRIGYGIAILVALAMLGKFGPAFASKQDLYPDGLILAGTIVGLVAAIAGIAGKG